MTEKYYTIDNSAIVNKDVKFGAIDMTTKFLPTTSGKFVVIPKEKKTESDRVNTLDFEKEKIIFSISKFARFGSGDSVRNHVTVYSCEYSYHEPKLERHIYYKSISDGSFWRYCTTSDGKYYKGQNYVNSTFVNLELQCFLFREESKFDVIESTDDPMTDCPSINRHRTSFVDRIESTTGRTISEYPLFTIINNAFGHVSIFEDYSGCLDNLINNFQNLIIKQKRESNPREITYNLELMSTTINLIDRMYKNNVFRERNPTESRTEFFKEVYKSFDEEFCSHFTFDVRTKVKLYENRWVNIETNWVLMTLYKIKIISKTGSEYYLYYMKYVLRDAAHTITEIPKIAYLHIVPTNSTITKFGLDSRYVSAGAFINKIFDYKIQTPITYTAGDRIGRIYKNLTFLADMQCNKNMLL